MGEGRAMVRKINPPPAILKIEGLSTGIDPRLVDDFTREPLAQPHAKPPKDIVDPKRKVRDDSALVIAALLPQHATDSALQRLEAMRKPKPAPRNEHKLGQYVMMLPKRPFRRV